jgi:hypothetical protein
MLLVFGSGYWRHFQLQDLIRRVVTRTAHQRPIAPSRHGGNPVHGIVRVVVLRPRSYDRAIGPLRKRILHGDHVTERIVAVAVAAGPRPQLTPWV